MSSSNTSTSFGAQPPDTPLAQLQAMLPTGGAGGSSANPHQAMTLNLASAIAMNNLLGMNQQQGFDPFLLANSAKLWLEMNLMNPLPNLLDLGGMTGQEQQQQPQQQQQQPVNPLYYLPVSQNMPVSTIAIFPSHYFPSIDSQVAKHMPLQSSVEHRDRKRSQPATEQEFGETAQPHLPKQPETSVCEPLASRDIEKCLDRILKEEIYDIFGDEDMKEEPSPSLLTIEERNKSVSVEMSLLEQFDYLAGDSSVHMVKSAGSASRKVSVREMDGPMRRSSSREHLVQKAFVSLPGSSSTPQKDQSPETPITLALICQVALSTRKTEDSNLSRSAQIEKTPTVWRGQLQIKTIEATVQLHFISGRHDFASLRLGPLVQLHSDNEPKMRISQTMKTEPNQILNVLTKLQVCGAACLGVPIGVSKKVASGNNKILKTHFLEYLTSKEAAGVASIPAIETRPASLVFFFPPSEFTETFISQYSVELYQRLKQNPGFGYLFVVVLPADDAAVP